MEDGSLRSEGFKVVCSLAEALGIILIKECL